jgi:methylenetetrahydrofolate dehydrogenase (NADP+) / methenyltetrahydrofolate cyclohydrolase
VAFPNKGDEMAQILKGKEVADALNQDSAAAILKLKDQKINPTLALIRLGNNPDDLAYEASIMKKAQSMGIQILQCNLAQDVDQKELESHILGFNQDPNVHGILLFRPLPSHMDEQAVLDLIDPQKDVDGVSEISMGKVYAGNQDCFGPCTAESVMAILKHYKIPIQGKRVVVLGRSLVIGKPVAMMLLGQNATVTLCHSKTQDLDAECKRGDILIAAVGKANMVDASFIHENQVVIDVGINVDRDGNLSGDVAFDVVEPLVSGITPVPGGVGTVTTAILMKHVIRSAQIKSETKM